MKQKKNIFNDLKVFKIQNLLLKNNHENNNFQIFDSTFFSQIKSGSDDEINYNITNPEINNFFNLNEYNSDNSDRKYDSKGK